MSSVLPKLVLSNIRPHAPSCVHRAVRNEVAERITFLRAKHSSFQPHLVIIQVGTNPSSSVYVRMKMKAAEEAGIKFTHVQLDEGINVQEVIKRVMALNTDDTVSGVLVQLPLGDHVSSEDERKVTEAISPEKDVDGCVFYVLAAVPFTYPCEVSMRTTLDISRLVRLSQSSRLARLLA